MNENWENLKLKNIFSKINGLWTGKKEPFVEVKVYTMTNFTKDSFLNKAKEPREVVASLSQFEKRKLQKGDILVEKSGGGPNQPVGRAVLFDIDNDENNTFSNFTTRLRINENFTDKVYPNFIHHFLRLKYIDGETEKFQKNSTNIRNLQLDEYLEQSFSFPPLHQQQRIVSILDRAFAAIDKAKANAEQNLQNAKELFESYLQGVFEKKGDGWQTRTLSDLVDEECKLSYGIVQPGQDYHDGLPVVRPTDLSTRYIKRQGLKLIDPKLAEGYKRTKLIGDELLLCVRGSTGVLSIATEELKGANVTRGIVPIRFNLELIDQEFGYYLLISNFVQNQIRAKTYGAALMQINIGDLRKIETPYPKSLNEQQTIVRKLDSLRTETQKLEVMYQKKMDDLEELKKSILQKAFAGELETEKAFAV
tara:strand:- start:57263 stop:58525 length:1263 start_codon:yes stop_codon:yes gene_type:complete